MTDSKYPNKPLAPWIPKSMRDSGANLDECCEGAGTASASEVAGLDEAFTPLNADKKEK
ncbi:MAG TPA: hypothetical protein VIH56_06745 [Candidatus Acidoferrales bacterium]